MTKRANLLSVFVGVSVLSDIFVKNGPLTVAYKIESTDFQLFGKAMSSTTPILKRKVSDLAGSMILFNSATLTAQERSFWRCIYNEVR